MSGTRTTRLVIVFGASLAILALMMATVDPQIQYTVDEIMDDPNAFEDTDIFVRGVVASGSLSHESMTFELDGESDTILIDFETSAIPDGFDEGRTIAVRGLMESDGANWIIKSSEIQTGCPSKYES